MIENDKEENRRSTSEQLFEITRMGGEQNLQVKRKITIESRQES